ncbi:MAG: EGF domain-containing protein [bacterium]
MLNGNMVRWLLAKTGSGALALALILSGCVDDGGASGEGCPTGLTDCDGLCANTDTDRANCGGCDDGSGSNTCLDGHVCSGGQCVLSCQDGLTHCDGLCTDTGTDRANCGGCDDGAGSNTCLDGQVCSGGQCALSCQDGLTNCGGLCTNTDFDATNCGGCDDGAGSNACAAGEACDEGLCVDIDECNQGLLTCDASATCVNTPGSFECVCNSGYEGDGFTCVDVDECSAGTHSCAADATCANTVGSYTCTCHENYVGDGQSCQHVCLAAVVPNCSGLPKSAWDTPNGICWVASAVQDCNTVCGQIPGFAYQMISGAVLNDATVLSIATTLYSHTTYPGYCGQVEEITAFSGANYEPGWNTTSITLSPSGCAGSPVNPIHINYATGTSASISEASTFPHVPYVRNEMMSGCSACSMDMEYAPISPCPCTLVP